MKRLTVLVLALSMPGCATLPAPSVSTRVATAINRADVAWEHVRMAAELALPLLPTARQDQVRAALSLGDAALTAARVASTNQAAAAALVKVEEQAKAITTPTPEP